MSTSRNLNPTPESLLAMAIWGDEYARQEGGCMDFLDGLDPSRKRVVANLLRRLSEAAIAHGRTLKDMSRTPS